MQGNGTMCRPPFTLVELPAFRICRVRRVLIMNICSTGLFLQYNIFFVPENGRNWSFHGDKLGENELNLLDYTGVGSVPTTNQRANSVSTINVGFFYQCHWWESLKQKLSSSETRLVEFSLGIYFSCRIQLTSWIAVWSNCCGRQSSRTQAPSFFF